MTYCTQQDLVDRGWQQELVELTDKTNTPATTIDATIVAAHILDASSTIDGYLAKRYTLPLVDVPPVLVKNAADIARYFLHGDSATKESPVERAFQNAMKWLRDIATGAVVLENAGQVPASAGGLHVRTNKPSRVFSRDSLDGH